MSHNAQTQHQLQGVAPHTLIHSNSLLSAALPQKGQGAALIAGQSPNLSTGQPAQSQREGECRGIMMERTLHVSINNSLGNLALAGPHGGLWKPVDGLQLKLFANLDSEATDACAATNQLNCAMIHEVTLLEHQSTFPIPLGVEINCVPPREVTELGQKYAYTVLPKTKSSAQQVIYRPEYLNDDMYEWHTQFPQYTAANLDTHGVIPVNNQPFVFVDCQHPVISLLRHNSHLIGCDIDSQKRMDNQYFKISKQVLQICCDTLRRKVLSQITSHDLNTLSVQIHRIDAESWEDLQDGAIAMRSFKIHANATPEEEEEAKRRHLRNFTSTPYSYMARIKIKYELPHAQ